MDQGKGKEQAMSPERLNSLMKKKSIEEANKRIDTETAPFTKIKMNIELAAGNKEAAEELSAALASSWMNGSKEKKQNAKSDSSTVILQGSKGVQAEGQSDKPVITSVEVVPMVPKPKPVSYICGGCGIENTLQQCDAVMCRECGYRILYKKRTHRIARYEAR